MSIQFAGVFVADQDKSLDFYTRVLGFVTISDIPLGPEARWLTVASPHGPAGVELLLEPNGHPAARAFQQAIRADGIAATSLRVDDLQREYERLVGLGVEFTMPPTSMGPTQVAVFDDTCGNLIQLHQN
ncbi:MAG TPA: VOC family protein [Planctomycetota bacterium]